MDETQPIPEDTRFSFTGWNIKDFLKGRRELLVTLVGAIAAYVVTHNPEFAAITGASVEIVYAIIDYYVSK